jgi:hypothetical protein
MLEYEAEGRAVREKNCTVKSASIGQGGGGEKQRRGLIGLSLQLIPSLTAQDMLTDGFELTKEVDDDIPF